MPLPDPCCTTCRYRPAAVRRVLALVAAYDDEADDADAMDGR